MYSAVSMGLLMSGSLGLMVGLTSVFLEYSNVIEWEVWSHSSVVISMSLIIDWMSIFFFSSVCLISGCVMKYSSYYMDGEVSYSRFVLAMCLFVGSMWLLIMSPNLISLLLGWDGLGLTSYILIIFYQSESSCNAGMLTVLSNRIGDVGILLSISFMFSSGCWDFCEKVEEWSSVSVYLVILAAFTKSAQLPFSAWLPAAMAAPTPVSALVHSSTLVTAGVFLLIRFSEMVMVSGVSVVLLAISMSTMLMAGLAAMGESDMKKVVALSTLSQLGLMVMILSMGLKELAFFHLVTHAMFKSTLFMCAGVVIHNNGNSQDYRDMSSVVVKSPVVMSMLSVTNLSLCGFPFMAGFYSKDTSVESVLGSWLNPVATVMIFLACGLTVGYSLRMLYLMNCSVSMSVSIGEGMDSDTQTVKSTLFLLLFSLSSGFFLQWSVIQIDFPILLSSFNKIFVFIASVLGGVVCFLWVQFSAKVSKNFKVAEWGLYSMWFLSLMGWKDFSKYFLKSGFMSGKMMDMGWFEYYGGKGGSVSINKMSGIFQVGQKSMLVSGFMVSSMLVIVLLFVGS
uniref:NADH dehydrogenase subunit 5 n=1 Tax=Gammarus nipponensis TaxID=353628 RepID=UPI00286B9E31|nr:NADH dehydrogenase subunit 5 [Gammarus nipponensis]WLS55463.1 NADH dehydrogenase subunit 5 [Gammarus nipponensis]